MQRIVTESGAMEAEHGCHDDTVMSLALANYVQAHGRPWKRRELYGK